MQDTKDPAQRGHPHLLFRISGSRWIRMDGGWSIQIVSVSISLSMSPRVASAYQSMIGTRGCPRCAFFVSCERVEWVSLLSPICGDGAEWVSLLWYDISCRFPHIGWT